jgi:predicted amidohydrolase
MKGPALLVSFLITFLPLAAISSEPADTNSLTVSAVQFRSTRDLGDNLSRIKTHIKQAAAKGSRVVLFPECALSGYFEDLITNLSPARIEEAIKDLSDTCRAAKIYAIIGTPTFSSGKIFNSALIISPTGKVVERYHKIQLAERWPEPGDHLSVFKIDDLPCSVIICHDERYPELVRLPVLAGARIIFYLSHESGLREENKINPYRAQIQARAVENTVFVVHANAPANKDTSGSHGQSRIIAPDGNIIKEASMFDEEVITATLRLNRATRANARGSLTRGPLQDWWKSGLDRVRVID